MHRLSGMQDRNGRRAILDNYLRACPHACHQSSKVARRLRLGYVDHIFSHTTIIHCSFALYWQRIVLHLCQMRQPSSFPAVK